MRYRLLITLALLLCAESAWAQPPTAESIAKAKGLFMTGKAAFDEKRHVEALSSFKQSLELIPRHSTILFIGHCYRELQRPDQALVNYLRFLELVQGGKVRIGRKVVEDVKNLVATLQPLMEKFEQGRQQYKQKQYEAALATFTEVLEQTQWPEVKRWMALCYRRLRQEDKALVQARAALAAYTQYLERWKQSNPDVAAPDQQQIEQQITKLIKLKARLTAAKAERSKGTLKIEGLPRSAVVLVDGKRVTLGPMGGTVRLQAGQHVLRVRASGYLPHKQRVKLPGGETVELTVALTRQLQEQKRSGLWFAMTLTAAGLALGSEVMAWVAFSQVDGMSSKDSSFGAMKALTMVGHISAAVFALATGASYYMYERSGRRTERPVRAALGVVPGPEQVVLSGVVQF